MYDQAIPERYKSDPDRYKRVLSAVEHAKRLRKLGDYMPLAIRKAANRFEVDETEISREMTDRRWHKKPLPKELPTKETVLDMCPECGYQIGPEDTKCYLCGNKL